MKQWKCVGMIGHWGLISKKEAGEKDELVKKNLRVGGEWDAMAPYPD